MKRTIAGLGLLGCVALVISGGVSAHSTAWGSKPDGEFGPWSAPVHLGPIVNSSGADAGPAISRDGLSLYLHSAPPGQAPDLYVSRRAAIDLPWEAPVNLGETVNSNAPDAGPVLSRNGHFLFFGSLGTGNFDIYVSRRRDRHDDFAWEAPIALPSPVNSSSFDVPGAYLETRNGRVQFYFQSDRANGLGAPGLDIYVTELKRDGTWSDPMYVAELNSAFQEGRTTIRSDGLEIIFHSTRDGNEDLYVARRNHVWEAWSMPESLGAPVNTPAGEVQPALSANGRTLYFASTRAGSGFDLYASTRSRLRSRD